MIGLDFYKKDSDDCNKVVEEFCDLNLKGRQIKKIEKINKWCRKYLTNVEGTSYDFPDVVKASPSTLLKLKAHLDFNYGKSLDSIMQELSFGAKTSYIEASLFKNMSDEAKKKLVNSLNVTVCPYCNRNYIISFENIRTCELDHFIPKNKYPIFAASFYNLIPSCSYCNTKKGEEEFEFYPHKPLDETDKIIRFSYNILGADYLKKIDEIDVMLDVIDSRFLKQANILNLEKIYKHHGDIVQDVLKKRQVFSDTYLNLLCNEFPVLFNTIDDVKELVFSVPIKSKDYSKRPLTKLISDIIDEVDKK